MRIADPTLRTLALLAAVLALPACYTGGRGGGGGDDDVADDDGSGDDDGSDDDASGDDDWSGQDSDGDRIADEDEGIGDPDGDGTPNDADEDSDGDGLLDRDEAGDADPATPPRDSDGDLVPDFLDRDSDDNGLLDSVEGSADNDGDGIGNASDTDDDGDGISDGYEIGLDPSNPVDWDGDGIPDYRDTDSDGDGLDDVIEGGDDPDGDGIPSNRDDDADNDGISDLDEAGSDTDNPPDSDSDGFYDFEDADSDNDGLGDAEEPGLGTSPFDRDSDGDGFSDLAEIEVGSDPTDAGSVIDGFYAELTPRSETTITVPFTPEILQADILFVLDTTCSMSGVLTTMASNFSQVVSQNTIPNIAFGVAEFDDYAYGGLGSAGSGDLPLRLTQQITTSTSLVQTGLSSLNIRDGGDGPEGSMEALYQAATGIGYDQDCNNSFDSSTDVRPFVASGMDAFGGSVSGSYNSSVPGTGSIGGAGFRAGSLPIIVYTTDNNMRDPEAGYAVPPSCSNPAGATAVAAAMADISGKLVAIGTNSTPISQMTALANATDSVADTNGDGVDEPLVYEGTSSATVTLVLDAIDALSNGGSFDLSLVVDDDPYDFVTDIAPLVYADVTVGDTVNFTLSVYPAVPQTATDQVFIFPVQLIGDGVSILAEWELVLVVRAG